MFKCECGKEFEKANSFNGHKSSCKEHHLAKYGNLDKYFERKTKSKNGLRKATDKFIEVTEQRKSVEVQTWLSEQHTCETCGKIMTEKFGSGRFCCRACANSHTLSVETKQKISSSVKQYAIDNPKPLKTKKVFVCECCGDKINDNKTKLCFNCLYHTDLGRERQIKVPGGYRQGSGIGKHGWYKGYWCDSSWELAYVIYNIDHNIEFRRNTEKFSYEFQGKTYNYIPDFIVDSVYIEIKGYWTEQWQAKADQFPFKLNILYKAEIQPYLDYVKSTYGEDFTRLYE